MTKILVSHVLDYHFSWLAVQGRLNFWNRPFTKAETFNFWSIFFVLGSSGLVLLGLDILGFMSVRLAPFQPLEIYSLQFQSFKLSTVHSFNRLLLRSLANSTYFFKLRVFNFFKSFQSHLSIWRIKWTSSKGQSYIIFKGHIGQTTIRTKIENDVFELHQKEIRCSLHLTTTRNLKELWFPVTGFEHFSKSEPACRPNVLPISEKTMSLGLIWLASQVKVLRRTPGGCKDALRQKIRNPFKL